VAHSSTHGIVKEASFKHDWLKHEPD